MAPRRIGPLPEDDRAPGFDPRRDARALLLGFRGRIGRATYAWTIGVVAVLWAGLPELLVRAVPDEAELAGWVLAAPLAWVAAALTAKRAHDVGMTGWLGVLLAVPVARWVLVLGLCGAPPEQAWNAHGRPPAKVRRMRR